jgi:prepilin-type N-terminal cleavage/methylation domain-containing protein
MNKNRNRNAGFTLIELMIVVEIIAVIMAIAIPSYLRTRLQANESSAVGNLRAIMDAQTAYHGANNRYAQNFDELTDGTPPFLNGDWDGARSGYAYRIDATPQFFTAHANPVEFGRTGWHGFLIDGSGVTRYEQGAEATAASQSL